MKLNIQQKEPTKSPDGTVQIELPPGIYVRTSKDYLREILKTPMGEEVSIVVPVGEAQKIIQRIRTELYRIKKEVESSGKRVKPFKLLSTVQETGDVDKGDIIVFRRVDDTVKDVVDLSDLAQMLDTVEHKA